MARNQNKSEMPKPPAAEDAPEELKDESSPELESEESAEVAEEKAPEKKPSKAKSKEEQLKEKQDFEDWKKPIEVVAIMNGVWKNVRKKPGDKFTIYGEKAFSKWWMKRI